MLHIASLVALLASGVLAAPITSSDPRVTYVDCTAGLPANFKGTTTPFPSTFACGRLTAPEDWSTPGGTNITVGFTINVPTSPDGVLF